MRFDKAESVEELVWIMRQADQARGADRAVLLRLFNGNPPFDSDTAEENNIEINRNDLTGPNLLAMARRQWNQAFLKPSQFFTCRTERGGPKSSTWNTQFTSRANRILKRDRRMIAQIRATGAQTVLYGVGPVNWKDRRSVIPQSIPMASLMVPSETEIDDFSNLSYFAIFREWTPALLYEMTHGPKVDPGWNLDLVDQELSRLQGEVQKSANSAGYRYMPERIEELVKQDKGYLGSDAVPTCDVWDFYFRESEDGKGWYRRILLDWGGGMSQKRPESKNRIKGESQFLYSSGKRKYADSLDEILHCQFGDCSAYAPFKYHSIRSLGWMLWGVCDLQNRLYCKFNESVYEQLMWFFQTAGDQDLRRLKKANFAHMGVIPQGIRFLTANERFIPPTNLIELAFRRNQELLEHSSTAYTQSYSSGPGGKERTATETMAILNSSQALTSAILEMAYTYEAFKYREMVRRLCLKHSTDPMAREFRLGCLQDGIPEDLMDVKHWDIEPERLVGGGNKVMQMATVNFLNQIRKNLPPDGQRLVDYLSVEAATDQPELARTMAPIDASTTISNSTHDAALATERLLRGLPFTPPKTAVYEDYVVSWLNDLGLLLKQYLGGGTLPTVVELNGLMNLAQHTAQFLGIMSGNEDDRLKVRQYQDAFGQLTNHLKGLAQRVQQSQQAQHGQQPGANGNGQAEAAAKIQAMLLQAQTKSQIAQNSAAQRTAQRQEQWEREESRKDAQLAADIQRQGLETRHELAANRLKSVQSVEETGMGL